MLSVTSRPLGPVQTNYYAIEDEDKNCLIIDPGEQGQVIIEDVERKGLKPIAILLTHGHFDHIGAVDHIRDYFNIPVYIHHVEANTLTDPTANGSNRYPELGSVENRPADHLITEEGIMNIGSFEFDVRFTPGHSPGSVTFVFENDGFAIVGDTLFYGSIGRTDLPGGNMDVLLQSIQDKILSLDEQTTIYSGHGPATTVLNEMESNPFLNGFNR